MTRVSDPAPAHIGDKRRSDRAAQDHIAGFSVASRLAGSTPLFGFTPRFGFSGLPSGVRLELQTYITVFTLCSYPSPANKVSAHIAFIDMNPLPMTHTSDSFPLDTKEENLTVEDVEATSTTLDPKVLKRAMFKVSWLSICSVFR